MKKVLITGSLGYIGSVLTDYLSNNGFSVIGYDTGFFKDCILYKPRETETIFKNAKDIDEKDLKGIDAVIHLAGISNDPFGNLSPEKVYDPTREYSLKLAKLCKRMDIQFIFASSCSIYGKGSDKELDEDSEVFPQTPYSLNKLQIEEGLKKLSDENFSPIALRFATAFGASPRIRFDVVINMFAGMGFTSGKIVLNSDGTPWRPNIYILDFCKAIVHTLNSVYKDGKLLILNVGDEQNNLQVIDIARIVASKIPGCEVKFLTKNPELDKTGLIKDKKVTGGVDTRTYKISFKKIRKTFPEFKCDWNIERGVEEMVEKFKELDLDEGVFKNRNFYRLQKMDDLYKNGFISANLEWLK
jgi:nucleoside-diphosphate-sugar epimerase